MKWVVGGHALQRLGLARSLSPHTMAARLHWLPTSLDHDGPAPVGDYFQPEATGEGVGAQAAGAHRRQLHPSRPPPTQARTAMACEWNVPPSGGGACSVGGRMGTGGSPDRAKRGVAHPPPSNSGATVPLPAGYAAYVLSPNPDAGADQMPVTASPQVDADGVPLPPPARAWPVAASFSAITYWKLDEHPAPTDGARRALEWVALADALAQPVPAAAVDAAIAAQSEVVCVE